MSGSELWSILKETASEWSDDNASRLASSLAYYTLLSIAPLVVLAISVAGMVFGEDAARGQIAQELSGVVGPGAAEGVQTVVGSAQAPEKGIVGSIVGIVVLLFGASGVFGELQSAMNEIWGVKPKPGLGILGLVRSRFFSVSMVFGVAFLLLVSMLLSAALAAVGSAFESKLPGGEVLWQIVNFGLSFALISALFSLMFKVLPDAKLTWREVWVGGTATALMFVVGKLLLGLYLGKSGIGSSYGAAGSLVALVIWVYYSAQILFFGAELTKVHSRHRGAQVIPTKDAVLDESKQSARNDKSSGDLPQTGRTQSPVR